MEKLTSAAQFRLIDLFIAMIVYLPVWHSHCTRSRFTVLVSCSGELAGRSFVGRGRLRNLRADSSTVGVYRLFKGVSGTRFGSLALKIGSLESEKITQGNKFFFIFCCIGFFNWFCTIFGCWFQICHQFFSACSGFHAIGIFNILILVVFCTYLLYSFTQ